MARQTDCNAYLSSHVRLRVSFLCQFFIKIGQAACRIGILRPCVQWQCLWSNARRRASEIIGVTNLRLFFVYRRRQIYASVLWNALMACTASTKCLARRGNMPGPTIQPVNLIWGLTCSLRSGILLLFIIENSFAATAVRVHPPP